MPCVYCGANDSQVGDSCSYSPTQRHILANGANKCVFCGAGASQIGDSCGYSPTKKHVLAY